MEESVLIFINDLEELFSEYEIIIIDDGSKDKTPDIAENLSQRFKQVKVIHHPENKGVGTALSSGFKEANYDFVLTNCVDRPFDIKDLKNIVPLLDAADVIVVARYDRSANAPFRKLTSLVNYWLIRLLFRIKVGDCQFVQIYKNSIVKNIHIESTDSFAPPEIILTAFEMGCTIKEVKAKFHARTKGVSKYNNPLRYLRALKEMLHFWYKWRIKGYKNRQHIMVK